MRASPQSTFVQRHRSSRALRSPTGDPRCSQLPAVGRRTSLESGTMTMTTPDLEEQRRDALAGRLFEATLGAFELLSVYLGDRLGLYGALRDHGPATAGQLAAAAGIDPRYAREWLEQQAVASFLEVDSVEAEPAARRYSLPDGHADVVLDPDHLALMAPMARFVVGAAQRMPELLDAYRTGEGVAWSDYGPDVIEAQAAINRPQFGTHVATSWIPPWPTSTRGFAASRAHGSPTSVAAPAGRRSRSPRATRRRSSTASTLIPDRSTRRTRCWPGSATISLPG
jgi:hypothetical protein